MKILKSISMLLIVLIMALSLSATGCKTAAKADPAKAEACKESAKVDSDTCKKCCKEAGAAGHMWTSGSGCKCL